MADDSNYYIAWDGKHYLGSPPRGWFLAADNRWWPSTDLIDGPGHQETEAGLADPDRETVTPPSDNHTTVGEPTAEWAPSGPSTDEPASPRGRRPGRSRKRRTSGRPPIAFLIFAAFAVSRCLSVGGQGDDNPPVVIPVEASVPAELETEPEAELVVANGGLYRASTESCVGGTIVGSISNFSGETRTFVVESAVPDGVARRSAPVTVASFGQAVWQIEAPVFGQDPCELSEVYTLE